MTVRARWSALTRRQRWAVVVATLLTLYGSAGFLLLPDLGRTRVPPLLTETLGRPVTIESVYLNPFALKLAVRGFRIDDTDSAPLVSLRELVVNVQTSSLFRRALTLKELRLTDPAVRLRVLPDGSLSFADVVEKLSAGEEPPEPEPDGEPFPLIIHRAAIDNGRVAIRDESRPTVFEETIAPIDISLDDFATRPDKDSQYSFTAVTDNGASVTWEGTLTIAPLHSAGEIRVAQFRSRTPWRYLRDDLNFELVSGSADAGLKYVFDGSAEPFTLKVSDAKLALSNIAMFESDTGRFVLSIPSFVAAGGSMDLAAREVRLASLKSDGVRTAVLREPDGRLRWQRIMSRREAPPPEAAAGQESAPAEQPESPASAPPFANGDAADDTEKDDANEEAPWKVTVDEIRLTNYTVDFSDETTPSPARIVVTPLDLAVDHLSTADSEPARVKLTAGFEAGGIFSSEGTLHVDPVAADLSAVLDGFLLMLVQPYVAQASGAVLRGGSLSTNLSIDYATPADGPAALEVAGDLSVASLDVGSRDGDDVLRLGKLVVTGLEATPDPLNVSIAGVDLAEPNVRIARRADGTTNLSVLGSAAATGDAASAPPAEAPTAAADTAPTAQPESAPPGEAAAPSPAVTADAGAQAAEPAAKAPAIQIARVNLSDGTVVVTDASLPSPFTLTVESLTGDVSGISNRPDAEVSVDVTAKIQRTGKLDVDAKLRPLGEVPDGRLHFVLANMDMAGFSPYSGKYVGQQIAKGKLGLDLDYRVDRAKLVAENKLALDAFTLGKRVESPDATDLPVGLALALLRDTTGKIALDVPVSGRLDDPAFKLSGVIVTTLRNLILKTATAPFALLGGLVGGSGEEMGRIAFTPGRADVGESEAVKLDSLAKALAERPALNLEIAGATAADVDMPALGEVLLDSRLKTMRFDEIRKRSDAPASAADVLLEDKHRERLLIEAYEAQSGQRVRDLRREAPTAADGEPEVDRDEWVRSEMKRRLIASFAVGERQLTELAGARADAIVRHLVEVAKLPAERVLVIAPSIEGVAEGDAVLVELVLVPS